MPRRPRRSRRAPREHVDRHAAKARRSQIERQELDARWAREHPTVAQQPSIDKSTEQEDEEASA